MPDILFTFLVVIFGAFTNWVAWSRGFYRLTHVPAPAVGLKNVIAVFAIYVGMMYLVAPMVGNLLFTLSRPLTPPAGLLSFLQFLLMGGMIALFYLYSQSLEKGFFKQIWKNTARPDAKPVYVDFAMGALTWFVSIPVVFVAGKIFDLIVAASFGPQTYEQVAVHYLKTTLGSPIQLVFALLTILLLAPAIEEFLFRGCLQTFFKRHLGTKAAILLTSLCFALFHFSTSQGIGNIALIGSLFVFACFLGFIYERQSSLFASIGLHMTFNLASALQIVLGGG